jgi:hypothetical protein
VCVLFQEKVLDVDFWVVQADIWSIGKAYCSAWNHSEYMVQEIIDQECVLEEIA